MHTQNTRRGFTLIELLVVVLIMGILTAVAVPQYQKAVKKAHGTEVLTMFEALDQALSTYYLEHGTYDGASPETLSIDIPELHHFQFAVGSPAVYKSRLETGALQFGSNQFGVPGKIVTLYSSDLIGITGFWVNGHLDYLKCFTSNVKNPASPCRDYFTCETTPRALDQTGTSYRGGDCFLK